MRFVAKKVAQLKRIEADEVEEATGLPHQTVSPAFSNLKKAGILVDSGSRRFTRLGRRVPAWAIDKDKEAQ